MRAIVGQQVSVRRMVALLGHIARRFGTPLEDAAPGLDVAFPGAARLAAADPDDVAALGMPKARARSIVSLAQAVEEGLMLAPGVDVDRTMERLLALPGIGPWTANYIAE